MKWTHQTAETDVVDFRLNDAKEYFLYTGRLIEYGFFLKKPQMLKGNNVKEESEIRGCDSIFRLESELPRGDMSPGMGKAENRGFLPNSSVESAWADLKSVSKQDLEK